LAEIEKGLEGVVIGKSAITFIDGLHGILRYRGIDIKELAKNSSYEEVSYLLWNGRLPTKTQLSKFAKDLSRQRSLSPAVVQVLKSLPRNSDPMEVARTAVSYVAAFPRKRSETFERANHRKAVQLASSLSTIVSTYDRVRRGQRPLRPDSKLGHAANFLYLRTGRKPSREFERAYDTICMLYADHEMNASTFAGCVTVSTLADLGGGVTSAIATLAGPLHGGSNQRVMEMLEKIVSVDKIEKFVDPRALILKEVADRLTQESKSRKWFDMAEKIEDYVWEKKNLRPNIEFYAAVTLNALGIPKDLMPSVFACNRIVGWIAHIFEQYADNRLMRPLTEYVGPEEQHYVPLSQRS